MPLGPAADERLGDAVHFERAHQPRLAAQRLKGVLQRQAVDDRGQHAHVVGGGFVDARVAGGELGPAQDIAAADDDGDLHALLLGPVGLRGNVHDLLHADAPLAGGGEALARKLQNDAL